MLLAASKPVVLACGALVRELRALGVDAQYLPAPLHNRPGDIPDAVETAIRQNVAKSAAAQFILGYGDCGTGGQLDARMSLLRDELGIEIERLPGDHCYSFFMGAEAFRELHDEELGTFFLTDFLARNFEPLVWKGLGLDNHPELRDMYFGNYRRVVYLAQVEDATTEQLARAAAERLGLIFEMRSTGLGPLRVALRTGTVS